MSYEIVRYEPAFKKQVLDLQTHLLSSSLALNSAYFEWKYERNPYLAEPLIYIAVHDGRAVGMRGFSGVEWEAGLPPQRFRGLYADDAVVLPDHRRGGLIHKIMAAAFKDLANRGYEYVFNLSAGPAIFHQSLSTGWHSVGYVQLMRWRPLPVSFQKGLGRILRRMPLMSHRLDALFLQWMKKRRRSLADIDQDRIKHAFKTIPWIFFEDRPRCAAMADLVKKIGSRGKIRHVRDGEYFDWRFQNPFRRYRFVFYEKAGLEGYLVLMERTSEFADKEALYVVDWEGTNAMVKAELLQAAFSYATNRAMYIWSATLAPETTAALNAKGFKMLRQPPEIPAILVRPVRDENLNSDWLLADRQLLDLANWELRMLYSMHG